LNYILAKVSLPNEWKKEFHSKEEATTELLHHICKCCIDDISWKNSEGKIIISQSLEDLLSTPCGLEFNYEEKENETIY